MSFDSREIANYFINKALNENSSITPMKVLKLVYFAHGWHLALTEKPLIKDQIEAWQYGPVIKELYDSVKRFGRHEITDLITKEDYLELLINSDKGTPFKHKFNANINALLERIWDVYSGFTAFQLSEITHERGSPWDKACSDGHVVISNDIIKNYFSERKAA